MKNRINLTFDGQTHSIKEWSVKLNIKYETFRRRTRLYKNNIEKIFSTSLSRGRRKGIIPWNKKHPSGVRKELNAWYSMHKRCYDPTNIAYPRYGGRGITIAKRWFKFENFINDMGKKPDGTSLDRKNNNKGYKKSNCRWADKITQANNNSRNINLTFEGETLTVAQWARRFNVDRNTIIHRAFKDRPLNYKRTYK